MAKFVWICDEDEYVDVGIDHADLLDAPELVGHARAPVIMSLMAPL